MQTAASDRLLLLLLLLSCQQEKSSIFLKVVGASIRTFIAWMNLSVLVASCKHQRRRTNTKTNTKKKVASKEGRKERREQLTFSPFHELFAHSVVHVHRQDGWVAPCTADLVCMFTMFRVLFLLFLSFFHPRSKKESDVVVA